MALRSVRVAVTVFGAHPLEFSTLLELPEVGTIYSHKSCKRPASETPLLWVLRGLNGGEGFFFHIAINFPVFVTPGLEF